MKPLQLITVIVLGSLVFGCAGYIFYDWLHPYRHLAGKVPVTYVPPIVGETEKARQLHGAGQLTKAQQLLRRQLRLSGRVPEAQSARELLGQINTEMFFSTAEPFGKTEYVVQRGDSLWRIARKLDSSPKTIMRTNNLASDRIRPGEKLLVPTAEFTVTLDLPNERVIVHTGDEFFKQYPIVMINLPRPVKRSITTRVQATSFWKDGKRLSNPSEAEQADGTPWLYLARGGYILYGVSEEEGVAEESVEVAAEKGGAEAAADPDTPPRGIALLKDDLLELQLLLERGTPVTIVANK